MFSLRDLRFLLRRTTHAKDYGLFILVTHKSTRLEKPITWLINLCGGPCGMAPAFDGKTKNVSHFSLSKCILNNQHFYLSYPEGWALGL